MERPFTFGPSLFTAADGSALSFHLQNCDNGSEIKEYIENGGGSLVNILGPFTISLEDATARGAGAPPRGRDTFRPDFIIKCCARNRLVPLKPFSNNASKFSDEFDPDDVLLHKMSWSEAGKFCTEETNKNGSSDSSAHAKRTRITKATGPRPVVKSLFTSNERQAMVEFIVKNDAYFELKGVAIWKKMEPKFPTHTWQSLKEHFHKKVMPEIKHYGLDKQQVDMFKEGTEKGTGRGSKKGFSNEEDAILLSYVKKYGEGKCLAGNNFWREMQRKNIVNGRSWQSVRQRYVKQFLGKSPSDLSHYSKNKRLKVDAESSGDESLKEGSSHEDPSDKRLKVKVEYSNDEPLEEDPSNEGRSNEDRSNEDRSNEDLLNEDSSDEETNYPKPKMRRLYNAGSMFDTPARYAPCTPVGPKPTMLQCLLRQEARRQKGIAELKRSHERSESASEGIIQGTCEDLESIPDDAPEASQDHSSSLDGPIHERSGVSNRERNEDIIEETWKDQEDQDQESELHAPEASQDLFSSLDSPIHEMSGVKGAFDSCKSDSFIDVNPPQVKENLRLSVVIDSENFSPTVLEYVDEMESERELGSSSAAFGSQQPISTDHTCSNLDQIDEDDSPWSQDGLRWTGCRTDHASPAHSQVGPKDMKDMNVQTPIKIDVGVQTKPVKIMYPTKGEMSGLKMNKKLPETSGFKFPKPSNVFCGSTSPVPAMLSLEHSLQGGESAIDPDSVCPSPRCLINPQ